MTATIETVGDVEQKAEPQTALAFAHNKFGSGLLTLGRPQEAAAAFERAVALDPEYSIAHSNLLYSLNFRSDISAAELFAAHLRWDECHGRKLRHWDDFKDISRDPERRLRVGYVSAHFYWHGSMQCREPLLAAHDHDKFEVFYYADVSRPDAVSERLRGYADHWIDIHGWSMQAVDARVRADRIDLLIDLSGHHTGNRLEVFARKPAPVQLGFVYPNTTGLSAIDYRIVDTITDPPGAEAFCSERLIRLPRCFLSYQSHLEVGAIMPPPARQSGQVTFGSFNILAKVTQEVIALWARVLHAVHGSRLFLKAPALADLAPRRRLLTAFAIQGIDPGRIRLESHTASPGHFACYGEIDIALDPFPFNGAVTSCDTIWMGVPLVSLRGDRHVARVGASLLTAIGLPELIAETPEDYVSIAAGLAGNLDRLAELRAGMRERMRASALGDGVGFARAIENAYRTVWRQWCIGEAVSRVAAAEIAK
jgi:protein O-GlcNAc transferase